MMYCLFTLHGITPMEIHKMNHKERKILYAFAQYELDKQAEQAEKDKARIDEILSKTGGGS